MAILAWRRAEIDARMKTVIASTKSMQEQDLMVGLAADRSGERMRWMQGVIREELHRPLYFDKMAMLKLEEQAQREAFAARRQVDNHDKLLDTMRFNILRRDPSIVKAALNSSSSKDDRGILAGVSKREETMRATLSLPALGGTNLGAESRKQLEMLDGLGEGIKHNRNMLRSKTDIVETVTRTANTHTKKKRPGSTKYVGSDALMRSSRRRGQRRGHTAPSPAHHSHSRPVGSPGFGDTTGSGGSGSGPATPMTPGAELQVGASAVSPEP